MLRCPVSIRMRRRKRMGTFLISTLDRLISCLEFCQTISKGPWKLCLFCALFLVLLFTGVWMLLTYDPCDGGKIRYDLCRQYQKGEVAGNLCYDLCELELPYLSYCQTSDDKEKSFLWHQTVVKINFAGQSESRWKLAEGTPISDFSGHLQTFLEEELGHSMYTDVMDKLLKFADFNEDGKLSLGEAQSLWRLVHIHEFLLLFLFHKSSTFPSINGTCGHVYAFQHTPINLLYKKDPESWLSKIFPDSYKWSFPNWPKRARVSLGMVEFSMDIFEEQGINFYLCDINPQSFGITYRYEAMLLSPHDIATEKMLKADLRNRTCFSDAHCIFSKHCQSTCSMRRGRCSGEIIRPGLFYVCDIIQEYLLYDTPKHLYYELKRLLERCSELTMAGSGVIQHAIIYEDLKTFLWKEIQYNAKA